MSQSKTTLTGFSTESSIYSDIKHITSHNVLYYFTNLWVCISCSWSLICSLSSISFILSSFSKDVCFFSWLTQQNIYNQNFYQLKNFRIVSFTNQKLVCLSTHSFWVSLSCSSLFSSWSFLTVSLRHAWVSGISDGCVSVLTESIWIADSESDTSSRLFCESDTLETCRFFICSTLWGKKRHCK